VPGRNVIDASTRHVRFPRWTGLVALIVLSIGSTFTCISNTWVQDDLPIIRGNLLVHTLAHPWVLFGQAYWPWPYPQDLYRPLTMISFAVQWVVGGGHEPTFRVVSILLYLGATFAVYRLALRCLGPGAAWVAAAWFAVHPVHVEAVAVAVNQAELVVAILLSLLVAAYLDRRRSGAPLTKRWMALIVVGYLAAMLFKENGAMLPAFLVAAELTIIDDGRSWRERLTLLRPLYLWFVLVAVCLAEVRTRVLAGNTKGSFTAEALGGLHIGGRALTMLGVVPQWFRLLFWPAHLQADYSPGEIVGTTHWGAAQSLGALLLIATAVLAWFCWRRRPVVTFGILWTAIGLIPISNVLIPTGIVLAERTLFLSSVGVVIAGTALLWPAGVWLYARGSIARIAVATGAIVLLAMGLSRSASRQMVWHDSAALWFQSITDAPRSWRAHHAYAAVLFGVDMKHTAELEYRKAMDLYPAALPVYIDLADKYRGAGMCEPALHLYQEVLIMMPAHNGVRGSEVACLLWLGRYQEASIEARIGASYGFQHTTLARYAEIADSAERVHAPPHTVNLPPPVDSIPRR
jgi:hypothetical protein